MQIKFNIAYKIAFRSINYKVEKLKHVTESLGRWNPIRWYPKTYISEHLNDVGNKSLT